MILRAVAAIAAWCRRHPHLANLATGIVIFVGSTLLWLAWDAAAPRPVIVVSEPGPVHPVDEQRWRTGAPLDLASVPAPASADVPPVGAPPHLIPPACSPSPCPTQAPKVEATWYDDGPGLYGAVHGYRFGDRRYTVRVCGHRCVIVTIRDYCRGCGTGIDLSPSAFRRLGYPLSRGRVSVTISAAH